MKMLYSEEIESVRDAYMADRIGSQARRKVNEAENEESGI